MRARRGHGQCGAFAVWSHDVCVSSSTFPSMGSSASPHTKRPLIHRQSEISMRRV